MQKRSFPLVLLATLVPSLAFGLLLPGAADAAPVTFSGTVSYSGTHTADTLYVVVLEPQEQPVWHAIAAFAAGSPPFSQPFSLQFDDASVTGPVVVAALLDLAAGGVEGATPGNGVLGWYGEGLEPQELLANQDRTGLDFSLPVAEIQGMITLRSGQTTAYVDVTPDLFCNGGGFRPTYYADAAGAYAIRGVYPGTYCVYAVDEGGTNPTLRVCAGDPSCAAPNTVTVSGTEVETGVDLDFTLITAVESVTWGSVKARY